MPYIDDSTYEGEQGSGNFMKLQPGENKIRIVSKTFNFKKHGFKDANGKYSSKICSGEGCEFCAEGNVPKNRYAWTIIDRKETDDSKKVKILEVGWSIYAQLLSYAKDEEYGDLTTYDVKVKKTGEGLDTEYQVVASPKTSELTAEEQQLVVEAKVDIENVFGGGKFAKKELPEGQESPEEETQEISIDDIPFK